MTDNTILRIQAFNDKELNALIEKAWGRTRPTPAELAKLIDKTRASLHEAPASFERGRKVFETNCGKCHKFDGKGAEVGPPLEGAGRDIEYILGNVLDPNRVIGAPYFVRTARLLDDTVFQGVLAEEDEQVDHAQDRERGAEEDQEGRPRWAGAGRREVADARGAGLQHDRRRTSATSCAT